MFLLRELLGASPFGHKDLGCRRITRSVWPGVARYGAAGNGLVSAAFYDTRANGFCLQA